ncbi:AarF/ABC1/UbiB kinase family protein [Corallococcus exiguus]|uniref:ABC1 kinase family protein n=1 Tax=Corallococcus TaxID=83461 RepID=UPI000ECA5FAC|nr:MULTISPECIES: AarF/ABC1/UbiB kinase family protein [Corallococcus]NNB88215.1 AarF/ABC1/UbiB kinase family protein [Corallococcus exiguus]NNB94612.1 AarF/ABC1/UbiB kinase family protein [Corallococcus exiguus]NNC08572.1 AarF/ABC1/UbiB kinase family protein [Corallococcus exiguus]NPC48927.1 AarF/ABC1/UbiB kinase family protein [Corallococcus exiguus]RKH84961.1 AarF/ABC1/UbiB kinase family protein [Corallococcus sp. AB032C]
MNLQDLNRIRQIALIAARHGFGEVTERAGVWRMLGGRKEKVEVSEEARRESTARRFRLFLSELGPTFIKLGQVLSTRADLLPAEFVEELATLQDDVEAIPLEQVHAQIRDALGKDVQELFAQVDPEPLAAASIAQVHRAVTLDGEEVVIKVQRPGIAQRIDADLGVLRSLARLLEAVVEETGIYSPSGIVDEFDRAIHEELDFINEATNIRAFLENHKDRPYLKIPRVHAALSSRTVLTMEFIRGEKIHPAALPEADRKQIAQHILEASFRQLFDDGLFHGDPHPGNVLLMEGNRLALLDFGVVGRLTRPMQETLVMLCLAVALKDSDSVARILYRVGVPDARANLMGFRNDIEAILGQHLPTTLGQVDARTLLRDLLDLAVKYRIRIPKEYALLSRASISTEGMLRGLYPELNIIEVALPYAKELMAGRYDPSQLQGGLMRTLLRFQSMAQDLPTQLSQILLDLETGKFSVTVRAEQFDKLNENLRSVAVIAFLGLCACGFIVGAFIAFAPRPPMYGNVPVLGIVGIALAAALFGAVLTWYLFGGRFGKVSVKRFLKKRR